MTNKFYIRSKAKTFYKGENALMAADWIQDQLDKKYAPDGYPALAKKYVITIKEVR